MESYRFRVGILLFLKNKYKIHGNYLLIKDSPDYSFLSDNNLIDLLSRLMEKDPKKRITIEEIMVYIYIIIT